MRAIDMTGQKIGKILILERDDEYRKQNNIKKKEVYWKCQCNCGKIFTAKGYHIRTGAIQSCGCHRSKVLSNDLTNKRFGNLRAVRNTGKKNNCGHYIWLCECQCGNEKEVPSSYLVNGHVQSCGCIVSIGESNIQKVLQKNKIAFEKEKWFPDFVYEDTNKHPRYDFYLPDYNRLIEFDGEQHFVENNLFGRKESLTEQQRKDQIKNEYAKRNKIELVRIPYTERDNITLDILLDDKYLLN